MCILQGNHDVGFGLKLQDIKALPPKGGAYTDIDGEEELYGVKRKQQKERLCKKKHSRQIEKRGALE